MNFHILTLFPEMVMGGLNTSITGRAIDKGLISVEAVNIRDYSKDKHHHVDDAPYGGGAGMVMQPEPIYDAYEDLAARTGKRPRVIYLTPQGQVFNQKIAEELAEEEDLVFLCGHYEGIDERALELVVPDYEEQQAVAEILSNMDSEIEALEQKLAKYRQVKQGMMQQLLTGKIRLV